MEVLSLTGDEGLYWPLRVSYIVCIEIKNVFIQKIAESKLVLGAGQYWAIHSWFLRSPRTIEFVSYSKNDKSKEMKLLKNTSLVNTSQSNILCKKISTYVEDFEKKLIYLFPSFNETQLETKKRTQNHRMTSRFGARMLTINKWEFLPSSSLSLSLSFSLSLPFSLSPSSSLSLSFELILTLFHTLKHTHMH